MVVPPAEGILMIDGRLHNQPASRLQNLLDLLVCGLSTMSKEDIITGEYWYAYFDMLSNEIRDFTCEPSSVINWTRGHLFCRYHTVCKQNTVIIVSEGGGLVNDPCTVRIGNVVVNKDLETLARVLRSGW